MKNLLSGFQSVSLLFTRAILAYGFYGPATHKWSDMKSTAAFFESVGIPFPMINAYMAATTELLGVILLTLGLFTRLISIPLMVVMVVAILTVHISNGFNTINNGFEIPLYYFIFAFSLASFGGGKFSLDYLLFEKK
ncbi:MAG: DoxX family protein [Campylobacterales bacterium]|nr:DoxX family protein [Campylobacterales bacterium]